MLPLSVRAALDEIGDPRHEALFTVLEKQPHEALAWMLTDHRLFGQRGARFFEGRETVDPFVIRETGILLSGKDVGRWDTDPGAGTFTLTIDGRVSFRVPLAAMPSHAGPIWQRRVALPILPHLVLLPDEPYAVEIEWKDAPPVAPMCFLDGWLFRQP